MEIAVSVAGVIVAFVVGVFAEPIKIYFTNRTERARLRRALYNEINSNCSHLLNVLTLIENHGEEMDGEKTSGMIDILLYHLTDNCYKYAQTKPDLFYQLKEASSIDYIYTTVMLNKHGKNLKTLPYEIRVHYFISILSDIAELIEDGFLDHKMMAQMTDSHGNRYMTKREIARRDKQLAKQRNSESDFLSKEAN